MTYSLILIDNVRSALCIAIKLHVEENITFYNIFCFRVGTFV